MTTEAIGHDSFIGQTFGHYRITEKIGSGGMGVVYRAHDDHLDREVAIKVLPLGTLADDSSRRRFRNEALALSKLNHPNIATVHDFDTQQGLDFLVMEYIPGVTLSDKLAESSFPEKQVLALGTQLADGLSAAHEQAVIHRDLKPGNLRITTDGRLKILDFGLAKLRASVAASPVSETLNETHAIVGTLPYMAPEQVLGGETDARTDIHAAGAVLYEMATGQRAFQAEDRSKLTSEILRSSPQPADSVNPKLSPELSRIIGKCMEREPENRYQYAKELAIDLRRMQSGQQSGVQPTGKAVRRWASKTTGVSLLVFAVALAVLVALIMGSVRQHLLSRNGVRQIDPSVAVLPFVDLSPERNQEYFSDGLAEELLNGLAKIQGLRVTARTSSFQFKGKNEDLRVVGQKLNVATILEGSVRKEGRRVRITAQLINAADGFHIWSETYDRELNDVFAVQENIARSVAASLKVELLGRELPKPHETNAEAYNAYLQGQYFYQQRSRDKWEKAADYYEQAIKLDPGYPPAWAALAWLRVRQGDFGYRSTKEAYERGREAAEQAVALDGNLADGQAVLGWIQMGYDWKWAAANDSFQRALALEPGNIRAIEGAAMLANAHGHTEEALRLCRRLVELNPLDAASHIELGDIANNAGYPEEATTALRKALELNPEVPQAHLELGLNHLAQSQPQRALAEMELEPELGWRLTGLALSYQALERSNEADNALAELISKYESTMAYQIAEIYAYRNQVDRSFEWLERAYAQHDGGLTDVIADPRMENLRHDLRYPVFLKKMHLVE